MFKFIRNLFKREDVNAEPDGWTNPLDPRGDGTLRKGDPMYDLMMNGSVSAVSGNWNPKTKQWDYNIHTDNDKK